MRTTVEIDDDVLAAVRGLARERKWTVGRTLSWLARRSLAATGTPVRVRNGVPLFSPVAAATAPHLELINELRDDS